MPVTKVKSRWTNGNLEFLDNSGNVIAYFDGTNRRLVVPAGSGNFVTGTVLNVRQRFTIAQVNAGATLLAAITGFKYRLIDAYAIAVGGAVAAVTTVDILSTQAASGVKLVAFAQASLTQNTLLRAGESGAAILAAGASFVANDSGAAVTVGVTGDPITTATHVDFNALYAVEAA